MKRFLCSLAVLGLLFPAPMVLAKGTPKPTPPPKHTVVQMITTDSITIGNGTTNKSFKLQPSTAFSFHGQKVTKEDIKPGMRVSVISFDNVFASQVSLSDIPKEPAAAPAPAKKK